MFWNFVKGLVGAGGIASLISYAPWLLVLVLAIAGGYEWFQVGQANDALTKAEQQKNAALVALGSAQTALLADEQTIAELKANEKANDALIEQQQHQIDEDARVSADAGMQIRNLRNADKGVDDYLNTAIPCGLRNLLNGPSKPGAGASGADEDCTHPAAQAEPVPATPASVSTHR